MASVQFKEATRVFPGAPSAAVDALDLTIDDGEFMVLVGPSGCGKSTSLRMLAGLEEITEGSVSIGDRDVTNVPPKDRDIAMVFQNYALYPHMSVADNMAFALKMQGVPKSERETRVAEAAKLLDITDMLARKPKALSGGQRQRVAMGRAIVRQPQVFCMDEPLSNLDAKLRVSTRTQIVSLQARLGVTTVYVTHDQVEAMTMGDRVAVLNRGVLQQVDKPMHLYHNPKNLFVAGFIGSPAMNLLKADVTEDGIKIGTRSVPLPPQNPVPGQGRRHRRRPPRSLAHRRPRRARSAGHRATGRGTRIRRLPLRHLTRARQRPGDRGPPRQETRLPEGQHRPARHRRRTHPRVRHRQRRPPQRLAAHGTLP